MRQVLIKDLAELEKFAARYASGLRGRDLIGLVGDLGAGKTAFVKALAKAVGVKKAVRSPTFILMQLLKVGAAFKKKTGISRLCHVDAYRLKNEDEFYAIGFGDYVDREDTVVLVEWADRVPSVRWLDHYREIKFAFGAGDARILTLDDGPSEEG